MSWNAFYGTLILSLLTALAAYMKKRGAKKFMENHDIEPPKSPEGQRFIEKFRK